MYFNTTPSKWTLILLLLLTGCKAIPFITKAPYDFDKDQRKTILREGQETPMRVFKINNYEDSILLRTASEKVLFGRDQKVLHTFVNRLYATVRDSLSMGVGIAAPQVGVLKNIIWVQRFDKDNLPFEVYINPKIIRYSEQKQDCREGCLSIPGRSDTTKTRSYSITIEYDQLNAVHKTEEVEGFTAVIFQHEIDHLNGILYLDHLEKEVAESK